MISWDTLPWENGYRSDELHSMTEEELQAKLELDEVMQEHPEKVMEIYINFDCNFVLDEYHNMTEEEL